ncbi:lysophospholipid acyltransferase 6 [Amyelois transitella]|uniref:lysophospholipid acyltransferase 6 n=1 Tax=Amyelois transitella TaxID=680683 RepID=UPI00299018AD|nr:lysophospholipid acyltransferase 6 [Amyelois transitella]XP_013199819.2 lysophospholipid acyltransferase 6 [Amyelois transitella]XP_013199820.2 lysophospholipid acyltransferase 6 [Amyelois transitella]XP_013199821.2 lysophospholipid acyltransferase 6 [Amyelois transitella]XP_060802761.1 lysophospholipid acyltransferase 6 [Amyelois transitella]
MSNTYYDYYDGSKIFQFISNHIGLPLDIVNFLIAQIAALCLARLFRKPLRLASPEFRHSLCLFIGLFMGYFCFGKQAIHLSVLPMMSYILLKTIPEHVMANGVLAASMIYLSCLHLHRQLYHTADYSLDITGPLMVITQRVTSLATSLQDSLMKKEINSNCSSRPDEESKVDKMPSPLEFFSYTLAFQTLMCGPVVFYNDYIRFIEGRKINGPDKDIESSEPSPRRAVLYKVCGSVAAAFLYLTLSKKYPMDVIKELMDPTSEVSRTWSALYLLWYTNLSVMLFRCKYYHAWLLSEAICNNSGMGFNGYDNHGVPKWDKVSNIDVIGFEFAQNFRTAIACWNKNTNAWLRAVAYERGGAAYRTVRVYALSAVWHGFYPGYYFTFFAGGLFTVAARKIRIVVRPMFLGSRYKKMFYDAVSLVTTRIAMTYATAPFILLHLGPSLAFYGKLYYSLHFLALGALLLPAGSRHSGKAQSTQNLPQNSSLVGAELNPLGSSTTIATAVENTGETNGKLKIS